MTVRLETVIESDLALRETIEMDPRMMAELGGTNTREQIRKAHYGSLEAIAEGTCWCFKIFAEGSEAAAGFIGIWLSDWRGILINEMGWMVLPEFQGQGIATAAGRQILDQARTERKFEAVHAFPGATNLGSNRICEKLGFSNLEPCEVEYQGRLLSCFHWRIILF